MPLLPFRLEYIFISVGGWFLRFPTTTWYEIWRDWFWKSAGLSGLKNLLVCFAAVANYFVLLNISIKSSRGLAVMHSTQTNMVLGSRPTTGHWWRQEGQPVLNAHARTKVLSEAVAKLEDMLVMHCMANAVLEYRFYLEIPSANCSKKEALCKILRFIRKSGFILSLLMTLVDSGCP